MLKLCLVVYIIRNFFKSKKMTCTNEKCFKFTHLDLFCDIQEKYVSLWHHIVAKSVSP